MSTADLFAQAAPTLTPSMPTDTRPHVMLVITKGESGGAQSHVLALCLALQHDIRFTVVIGGEGVDSPLGRQLQAQQINVRAAPHMRESLRPWHLWAGLGDLQKLIVELQPDLIHGHSAIAGMLSRLAARRAGLRALYTVHGFGFKPEVPTLRRHLAELAERLLAPWTARMICVSEHERELAYMLGVDPKRVEVIHNGLPDVTPHASPGNAPRPHLVMVARMKAPKRHDLLLRALAIVRDRLGYELPTTMAGDGPLMVQHQALAVQLGLQQVFWIGDCDHVPELLAQHQALVLASDHEGMPITVLEAMRGGLIVLASDLPGIREQISHEQHGLLFANQSEALANQLLRLTTEPEHVAELARQGRARFQEHFHSARMAQRTLAVYRQCLADTPSASMQTSSSALASDHVRRKDRLFGWMSLGVLCLLPCAALGHVFIQMNWVTSLFMDTLLWCILPYAVACNLLLRNAQLPAAEHAGMLVIATLAPFALTPLGFALLQRPYSRGALLLAYLATACWLWLGYRRLVKTRQLQLLCLDPDASRSVADFVADPTLLSHIQFLAWNGQHDTPIPLCDGVIVARSTTPSPEQTRLIGHLKMQHLRIYSVESIAEMLSGRKMLPEESTLWEIDNDPIYDRMKRMMDLALVLALSPLWLPLGALVALAVRLDSPGPALYSQMRVGRDGYAFRLWKFRSMTHTPQAQSVQFAQARDPRITRVGHFIRRTRLDEIPQLFNVLRGHMSLIGPRPEQLPFVREFSKNIPSYPYRHLVRPGLTGWAQVQQGYADSADTTRIKLSYDLYYVANYSLALDLLIVGKTIRTVLTGFGAR